MREIKFRAWHKYGKSAYPAIPGMVYDKNPGDCLTWLNQGQEIEAVMQYTGLKDRNGVKIFEGDIVWLDDFYIGDSFYKARNGVVAWHDGDGGFSVIDSINDFETELDSCAVLNHGIKVIGNIYENHELLAPAPGGE